MPIGSSPSSLDATSAAEARRETSSTTVSNALPRATVENFVPNPHGPSKTEAAIYILRESIAALIPLFNQSHLASRGELDSSYCFN